MTGMKKAFGVMTAAAMGFMIASCSMDSTTDITTPGTEGTATGTWKVSYYFDNSDGVTDDFAGYVFNFTDDGNMTATQDSATFSGTWVIKNGDDDPVFNEEMTITISGNELMDRLNHKWVVTAMTSTTMELKDDSGEEEIHFEQVL